MKSALAALKACPKYGAAGCQRWGSDFCQPGAAQDPAASSSSCLVVLWDSKVTWEAFCLESFISRLLSLSFNPRLLTIHCC